jgi:hypothetical protein
MEDSQIFLKEDDVLSTPATVLMYQCTFKVSEFLTIMQSKMMEEKLFSDGMDCELLSAGKAWTKGKVRVRLEFSPEPDVWEQKALPAASEEQDVAPNYAEDSSDETDPDDELNISDSTEITNNFPISRYPDNHPHSVGMWS